MSDFERPIITKIYQLLDEINEYVHPKFLFDTELAERYGYENKVKLEKHLERQEYTYIDKYAKIEYKNKSTVTLTIIKDPKAYIGDSNPWKVALSSHKLYKCRYSNNMYSFKELYHFPDLESVYKFLTSIDIKDIFSGLSYITFECDPNDDGYPTYPVKFEPGIDTAILKIKNDLKLAEGMAYV